MLFEHATLVYMRARRLEGSLFGVQTKRRVLARLSRQSMRLAVTERGADLRYGSARDIFVYLMQELGMLEVRSNIDRAIASGFADISAKLAEAGTRSARRVGFIGVVIALIAALPNLPEILSLVETARATDPDASVWTLVEVVASSPLQLSALLLALVSLLASLSAVRATTNVFRYFSRRRKRGYVSRITDYRVSSGMDPNTEG